VRPDVTANVIANLTAMSPPEENLEPGGSGDVTAVSPRCHRRWSEGVEGLFGQIGEFLLRSSARPFQMPEQSNHNKMEVAAVAHYDRDLVLANVDLAELATEVCGPPQGRGPSARWRCPNPDHPDAHPSMTVYAGQRSQRWKCHSCGDGGTAVDLVMTVRGCGVREAIEALAARAQVLPHPEAPAPADHAAPPRRVGTRTPDGRPAARVGTEPATKPVRLQVTETPPDTGDARIESYVAVAAQILWGTQGQLGRDWLHARALTDDVLHANRVGFDPGPRTFRRDRGLPWRGAGIVYPVLATDGTALYCQTRYLDPTAAGRDKYDNPTSALAANPRVAALRTPRPDPALEELVVVTEGIPDGLAVAHLGARVGAVIGAANHGPLVAHRLDLLFPAGSFLLLFDSDHAGRRGGALLGAHLAALDRRVVLGAPPAAHNDLNDWWKADPDAVADAVSAGARSGLYRPDAGLRELTGDIHPADALAPDGAGPGDPSRWPARQLADVGVAGT